MTPVLPCAATDVPVLPRGTRLHADRVRSRTVLLAPERVVELDETGAVILSEIDGLRSVREIALRLAERYDAPASEIETDVAVFLGDLVARGYLRT